MDILEIGKICRDAGYYDKAKVSLCAFSNGQIFIDGNLSDLQEQAKAEGYEFYLLKGDLPKPKEDEDVKEPNQGRTSKKGS
jgi:hypothetical protein